MVTADTATAELPAEVPKATRVTRWTAQELQAAFIGDVYRYVSRRLSRREDAEDVTAEVFAAAFQALPRFRGNCEPRLWLLGIARRKLADALRKKQLQRETLASDDQAAVDAVADVTASLQIVAERGEERAMVRGIIDGLRPAWRDVLTLHYADGLTVEEIAVVIRRSPGAVNSLLQRARAAVYREGKAYFVDEEGSEQ